MAAPHRSSSTAAAAPQTIAGAAATLQQPRGAAASAPQQTASAAGAQPSASAAKSDSTANTPAKPAEAAPWEAKDVYNNASKVDKKRRNETRSYKTLSAVHDMQEQQANRHQSQRLQAMQRGHMVQQLSYGMAQVRPQGSLAS